MAHNITCTQCGARYQVAPEVIGRAVICSQCKTTFSAADDDAPTVVEKAGGAIWSGIKSTATAAKGAAIAAKAMIPKKEDAPPAPAPQQAPPARQAPPPKLSSNHTAAAPQPPKANHDGTLEVHPSPFRNSPLKIGLLWTLFVVFPVCMCFANPLSPWWLGWAASWCVVVLYIFRNYLESWSTTLRIADGRVLVNRGLISRSSSEVRIADIRSIEVRQGILQRIWGTGDLAISSSGQAGFEVVVIGIPDPENIAAYIRQLQGVR